MSNVGKLNFYDWYEHENQGEHYVFDIYYIKYFKGEVLHIYKEMIVMGSGNQSIHNWMVYTKKRPHTWDPVRLARKSNSISRLKRWKSQQRRRASRSSAITADNRHTITTISTLTFSNKNSILHWQCHQENAKDQCRQHQRPHSVFHSQSLLFLFGFLFFPCWWIGGYYVKCVTNDIETTTIIIHPSMIANGKTSSRLFQLPHYADMDSKSSSSFDEILFFYKWNRCMSIFSIFLVLIVISMLVWYLAIKWKLSGYLIHFLRLKRRLFLEKKVYFFIVLI